MGARRKRPSGMAVVHVRMRSTYSTVNTMMHTVSSVCSTSADTPLVTYDPTPGVARHFGLLD